MAESVFQILDAFPTLDGMDGDVVLAGVWLGDGDLAVGDELWVPLRTGNRSRSRVAMFPLMSFVDRTWRAVCVDGVMADQVEVGDRAVQVEG